MSQRPRPTEIKLQKASRQLDVHFDDDSHFRFSCEFLRVFSPSAEVQGHAPDQAVLQTGKAETNIEAIEAVGNYAVRLVFSDGHNSGLYSWDLLYRFGQQQEQLWQGYLQRLQEAGASRNYSSTTIGHDHEH